MADEKKKPWQFSLGRMLGAVTVICVTLAASGALFSAYIITPAAFVVLMGFGIAGGIIVGCKKGALAVPLVALTCMAGFWILVILGNIIFN